MHSEAVINQWISCTMGCPLWSRILGVSIIFVLDDGKEWLVTSQKSRLGKSSQQDIVQEFVPFHFKSNEYLKLKAFHKVFRTLYEKAWVLTLLAVATGEIHRTRHCKSLSRLH